jgi:hypothetical protein
MSKGLNRTSTLALLSLVAACSAATGGGSGSGQEPVTGSCATPVVVDRSLFVASVDDEGNANPFGVAALKDFSYKKVMDQIVATGATGSKQTALELYQQMLNTLNTKSKKNPDGCTGKINGFAVECPRIEGALASTNPFTGEDAGGSGAEDGGTGDGGPPPPPTDGGVRKDASSPSDSGGEFDGGIGESDGGGGGESDGGIGESDGGIGEPDGGESDGGMGIGDAGQPPPPTNIDQMIPVALVNRFDLAPSNGANCGEYRIVFAIPNPGFPVFRFLMIYEATMPNPAPKQGLAACLPIAQFWDDLSASSVTEEDFTSQLEKFYFRGIPGLKGNPDFPPVIQAQNYGIGAPANTNTGQIRLNMFSPDLWELRQFTLSQACTGSGKSEVCTLTANNTFVTNNPFGELFAKGGNATFQKEFISQVKSLAADTIPLISMTTPNVDNAGQSNEQDDTNDYACLAGLGVAEGDFSCPNPLPAKNTSLSTAIQDELTKLKITNLTPDDIVQRATTQSCAGCHENSPGTKLGGGLTWPQSEGFTQVNEQGFQSPALSQVFLPFRSKVLTTFINDNCSGASSTTGDGTTTVGGQLANSAN